ncbi:hypothetical protein ACFSJW_23105 [Flavobacterium artemisiae]|uniref:Secreted protein n=1 Tax=Flavobacterium artemisiae TaxID=2126556 RepID=A0ABW4H7Y6_9FLAO
MFKQVVYSFICLFTIELYSQSQYKIPVYENKRKIGNINDITSSYCNDCYAIYRYKIFNKDLLIKIPVEINELQNGKIAQNYLKGICTIVLTKKNKNTIIIKFNSIYNGNSYWLDISKINGQLYITKKFKYSNSVHHKKADDGDVESFLSTLICSQSLRIRIKTEISFSNLFEKEDKKNICFDCPINYTIDECVRTQQKKKKFVWK